MVSHCSIRLRRLVLACFLFGIALTAASVSGQGLSVAEPVEVGMCSQRLERLADFVEGRIAGNEFAGAVTLVARHGKIVYSRAFGMADLEEGKPMREDAIFRIASMTKPITSVAAMMLFEEGHFMLDDPVSKFLPEFANPQVLTEAPSTDTEPAEREITIRHLLTHQAGFIYEPYDDRLGKMYRDADIPMGFTHFDGSLEEGIKRLAGIPLLIHPGERFQYGLATDVLGRVVEVVSKMSLDQFFRERIFQPLGMKDTHFVIPPEKVTRLAAVHEPDERGGLRKYPDGHLERPFRLGDIESTFRFSIDYPYHGPRRYFSGGAGLCSTTADYAQFCQMLLNQGELNGHRLLSRKTIELMMTNQLGDTETFFPGARLGLGIAFVHDVSRGPWNVSKGSYMLGGAFMTVAIVDPQENLIMMLMTQSPPTGISEFFWNFPILAAQAIVD
jgi:CubicO group peptidase (beta-lactamase class C family)